MKEIKVALIGTPNVGKSTIYNTLTKNNVHTGNWAGKTVEFSSGECEYQNVLYKIYDLPGTYSLISKSQEEMVTTDFLWDKDFDVAVVVCDATSLEKGMNLVLQTMEICKNVVVCVNLIDEAYKKGIVIDYNLLSENLGCPVVKTSARDNVGLNALLEEINQVKERVGFDLNYGILNKSIKKVMRDIDDGFKNKKWLALRLLEENKHYTKKFGFYLKNKETLKLEKEKLKDVDITLNIVESINERVKGMLEGVVSYKVKNFDSRERKIDKILTSKIFGIPIMLFFMFVLFYLTIVGANYPSSLLFDFFASLESGINNILHFLNFPHWLISLMVDGVYRTLYWVVSVMMPPMLIFFPLFTFLEDYGILPRIAFNMDKAFQKCQACGKQALTMCMGIGCNAVGVTGARIIDSKRERLIAILTNVFVPCNGKFPTLIAIITIFFVGLNKTLGSLLCALILTGFIALGILITFLVSFILSKTILKGCSSGFTLELPNYRRPKIWKTLCYSLKNKAIFVLGRAVTVAIPAGIIIWCVANISLRGVSILGHLTEFLNPIGVLLGLDGVIILALMLGFPANEIVVPAMMMGYLNTGMLTDFSSLVELKNILVVNGWTMKTALCFLIIMMFHYPCSTTILTIKKETGSLWYTFLAFVIPTVVGVALCLIVNLLF